MYLHIGNKGAFGGDYDFWTNHIRNYETNFWELYKFVCHFQRNYLVLFGAIWDRLGAVFQMTRER